MSSPARSPTVNHSSALASLGAGTPDTGRRLAGGPAEQKPAREPNLTGTPLSRYSLIYRP
jgi:hypothetical protein